MATEKEPGHSSVTIDRVTTEMTPEGYASVTIRATVPPAKWPPREGGVPREQYLACLAAMQAEIPKLLPRLLTEAQ